MNAVWIDSLQVAHRYWLFPFALLGLGTLGVLAASLIGQRELPAWFPRLNRFFLIALDMQWMLGGLYWLSAQQWLAASPLAAFRHPVLMTAVWIMYRYGNRKMKNSFDARARVRDGFAYYLLSSVFVAVGVWQIVRG